MDTSAGTPHPAGGVGIVYPSFHHAHKIIDKSIHCAAPLKKVSQHDLGTHGGAIPFRRSGFRRTPLLPLAIMTGSFVRETALFVALLFTSIHWEIWGNGSHRLTTAWSDRGVGYRKNERLMTFVLWCGKQDLNLHVLSEH